jgi:hypothetical protein
LVRQHTLNYKELQDKLQKLDKKNAKNFKEIYHVINLLIEDKTHQEALQNREPIGFKTKTTS